MLVTPPNGWVVGAGIRKVQPRSDQEGVQYVLWEESLKGYLLKVENKILVQVGEFETITSHTTFEGIGIRAGSS